MAETIFGEYKYTTNTDMSGVIVTAEDKMKEYYSSFITSINISTVDYSVISMKNCFENCINLKSVISIPSSIIDMDRAFYNCKSLSGSIHVYNIPESYEDIFTGTKKNIYIIPHSETIKEAWEEISSTYSNVKVEVEPIIDTYNNVVNTITIGGYDEEELENKIVSYLDLICDDNVYIQPETDLDSLVKELGWERYIKDQDNDLNNYFYFEVFDTSESANVGFEKNTYYAKSLYSADPIDIDYSKFVNYVEPTFLYSYNQRDWFSYTLGSTISIGSGEESNKVYFKGNNLYQWYDEYEEQTTYESSTVKHKFKIWINTIIENNYVCGCGNIMSLRYGDEYRENYLTIPCSNAFKGLFYDCDYLKKFYLLPSINLTDHCYSQMFFGCINLEVIPELPATILTDYCYSGMFSYCTSLTTAPSLSTASLANYCYGDDELIKTTYLFSWSTSGGMFANCSRLTTPPVLPATIMKEGCYSRMFYYCTGLRSTPILSSTVLAPKCYSGMFYNCISLTTPPSLPATTLSEACYLSMFQYCTSLTVAPSLPATKAEKECYAGMFYGCESLTIAPSLPATTLAEYCYSGMFSHCTSLTTAPSLPATKLVKGCYGIGWLDFSEGHAGMFSYCKSLTVPPSLPSTTLAEECYGHMFQGCTSLTKIPKLPATTLPIECYHMMYSDSNVRGYSTSASPCTKSYRIPTSGTGSAGSKSLEDMFEPIDDSVTANFSPSVNTTFYINVASF